METVSEGLARFIDDLKFEKIPAKVVEKVKVHILDVVGIMLASSQYDFGRAVYNTAKTMGTGEGCTVIGFPDEMPTPSAVLVNGTLAHGLDYDDTHIEGIVHASAASTPIALAVGEEMGKGGREVLTSLIGGLEVITRLGVAARGGLHPRGFHPTPIFGALSSSLIAGKIYGSSRDVMAGAVGLAGTMGSGLLEIENSWLKRLHPGWGSHAGVLAAHLSRNGFPGPKTILEGKLGLYASHLYGASYDLKSILHNIGVEWEALNIQIKPYPCCHFIHSFIDCAKKLKSEHGIAKEDISEVLFKVSEPLKILCEPREERFHPPTEYAAQFSIPFLAATVFCYGDVDLESFKAERLKDKNVAALIDKMNWELDPESDFPKHFPGYLQVKTRGGSMFECRERGNRGTAEKPITKEEVKEKYEANVRNVIPAAVAKKIAGMIDNFEQMKNVKELMSLLHKK